MAKIIGAVVRLNKLDTIFHASTAVILVVQDGKSVAVTLFYNAVHIC